MYEETGLDQQNNKYKYNAIVPDGYMHVEIVSPTSNLDRFYEQAGRVLVEKQMLKNKTQS